jgi:inorganic phosphate transporter, PiT family
VELQHISRMERAARRSNAEVLRLGLGLLFVAAVMLYAATIGDGGGTALVVAAVMGCYMAMNIGANDVGNNVGPAVGAGALPLAVALLVAAIFEAAGALIAGGEVIGTLRSGIIDPSGIADPRTFGWVMVSALMAAGLWINVATATGAPVSTTHSIVGAVLGAGIASSGPGIANWDVIGAVVASWIVSPLIGGVVAAAFLYLIKRTILYQHDMLAAAIRTVPHLVALMTWAFTTYLLVMTSGRLWTIGLVQAAVLGLVVALAALKLVRPAIARRARAIGNTKKGINRLFNVPLIVAAALLSFAHGSNDVANAVGPLAAVVHVLGSGGTALIDTAPVPLWTMVVGALGICVGLALYGPRVIRTIGSDITELDQVRAFCVGMSAAVTVIIASALGLPVSSTHIVVGGVFGVGFLREYLKSSHARMVAEIRARHSQQDHAAIDGFLARFEAASLEAKGQMLRELKARSKQQLDPANFSKFERKELRRMYEDELVKRSQVVRIIFAWIVTVPASAGMAALVFFAIRGMTLR